MKVFRELGLSCASRAVLAVCCVSVVIFASAIFSGQAVNAQEPKAYTISNYPVQAVAKNAVVAKKRAVADGQRAAFRSLLKRIVPVSAYSSLAQAMRAKSGDFLSGISVRSEQNSSTEYIASLDYIFSADATRQFLRQQGVPFIDEAASVTTVVPVFRSAPGQKPSAQLGDWGATWQGLDLSNTITPVRIMALAASVHTDTLKALESGDALALRTVAGEYGTGPVVFAIATPDKKARKLKVMLVGRDGTGTISLKRSYPLAAGDLAYAMEYGAVISLGIFEGRWKATRARSRGGVGVLSGPGVPLMMQVQFSNPGQWYRIQERLRAVDGVGDMRVTGVSARSADVAMTFPGGGGQLANVLARQGFSLRQAGGVWVLRPSY